MNFHIKKIISLREVAVIFIITALYLAVFMVLHNYFGVQPVPIISLPVVVSCWYWGIKRGLMAGTFVIISGVLFVLIFKLHQGDTVLGIIAIIMAFVLGTGAGWVRELYERERKHSRMLAEKQDALNNSRNFLDAVINNAGDPMSVKDEEHKYILINDAFCRLMEQNREDLLGKTCFDIFPGEQAERIFRKDEMALSKGEVLNYELFSVDSLGKRHVVVSNSRVYQEESGRKFVITNLRDETRRKDLEDEINSALLREKELNDMKSKFISMVSHEYRTPLTAILSSAELLELFGSNMAPDEKQEHFDDIKNSVDYLTSLLSDVLLINRTESGRMEYNPSAFELISFSREILKNFTESGKCRIELDADLASRTVNMDKKLLRYILTNLLSNALKYSGGSTSVLFKIQGRDGWIDFEIKDEGIGIPPEDQAHLFEPFFRGNNISNIPGTGLGLSIVKNCVELHKGNISFESRTGGGTVFRVCLPDKS